MVTYIETTSIKRISQAIIWLKKKIFNLVEFIKGNIKKKLRDRPTRELTISELMAHSRSHYRLFHSVLALVPYW